MCVMPRTVGIPDRRNNALTSGDSAARLLASPAPQLDPPAASFVESTPFCDLRYASAARPSAIGNGDAPQPSAYRGGAPADGGGGGGGGRAARPDRPPVSPKPRLSNVMT